SAGVANTYAGRGPGMTAGCPSIPQATNLDPVKEELHDLLRRAAFAGELVRVPLAQAYAVAKAAARGHHPPVADLQVVDERRAQPLGPHREAEVVAADGAGPFASLHDEGRHPLRGPPLADADVPHLADVDVLFP